MSRSATEDAPPLPLWAEVALLALILIGAGALRLALIGGQPAGPHHDEAANLLDALDVLEGRHTVFSPRSYGREMLAMYVAAPFVAALGATSLAVRLPTAIAGILTILSTYLLARELFREEGRRRAQWTALLSALFLALSFWLLVLNRIGLRANYLPLVEVLAFLFLWRGLRTGRLREFAAGGFFLGLAFHTYLSARFVPVALICFLGVLLLRREGRALIFPPAPGSGLPTWRSALQRWRPWLLLGTVALLVAAPLLAFFAAHPESFLLRAGGVSIFNPKLHGGDRLGLWARSVLGNLGTFGFGGDQNWLYNLPGRPGLDPVQAILFWPGLVACLARWRQPRRLFLAVWWFVMLLPSILAPDPIPHYLRAIGTLPPAAIIAARAAAGLLSAPSRRRPWAESRRQATLSLLLPAAFLVYAGWAGTGVWHAYFRTWLPRDEVYYAYHGHLADLAGQMDRDPDPEAVYLFPVNYDRRDDPYTSNTLEVLRRGPTPFHYILVDDASVARALTRMCAGHRQVRLVVWTHGEHIDADPRQVLPFFLERFGVKTGEQALRGYQIVSYELPSANVDMMAPLPFRSLTADYGPLKLAGAAFESAPASGTAAWVALRWQVAESPAEDLRISLRLTDAAGHPIGQVDGTLMDNEHRATSRWLPGRDVTTYHLVPNRPGTQPGPARLALVLYEPESLRPVSFAGPPVVSPDAPLDLGSLDIGRPVQPPEVEPEVPLKARLARGVELTGYAPGREAAAPGEVVPLLLYWHARRAPARDYAIHIRLLDANGREAAEWVSAPALPTGQWQPGDTWRDWQDLRILAGVPAGSYTLAIALVDSDLPGPPEVLLGSLQIEGGNEP